MIDEQLFRSCAIASLPAGSTLNAKPRRVALRTAKRRPNSQPRRLRYDAKMRIAATLSLAWLRASVQNAANSNRRMLCPLMLPWMSSLKKLS